MLTALKARRLPRPLIVLAFLAARIGYGVRRLIRVPLTLFGSPGRGWRGEEGVLAFSHTAEVIRAEKILNDEGLEVRVMGPPPDMRTGCDMVLVFPLLFEPRAMRCLERAGIEPLSVQPLRHLALEPVSLFQTRILDGFLMVRAANMKICLDPADGRIVNISGGGCPDVPYLASLLVGRNIEEADPPKEHGKTLCSYSLQKAFEEARRILAQPHTLPPGEARRILAHPHTLPPHTLPPGAAGRGRESAAPPGPAGTAGTASVTPGGTSARGEYCLLPESLSLGRVLSGPYKPLADARPWLVCGIVPWEDFGFSLGSWRLDERDLVWDGGPLQPARTRLPVQRGTAALLGAALTVSRALGVPPLQTLLAGDTGTGDGSMALYRYLADALKGGSPWRGITFHYMFPDLDGHGRVMAALDALDARDARDVSGAPDGSGAPGKTAPLLAADAGFMYVAKMSGYARRYDLFTPDAGELAFLADEEAPHPFYTRGFLLERAEDAGDAAELAAAAWEAGNSARYLLIKGARDRLAHEGRVMGEVSLPMVDNLEPIGGTGDLLTGTATALLSAGLDIPAATLSAAWANRLAGQAARARPDSQAADLLEPLARVFSV